MRRQLKKDDRLLRWGFSPTRIGGKVRRVSSGPAASEQSKEFNAYDGTLRTPLRLQYAAKTPTNINPTQSMAIELGSGVFTLTSVNWDSPPMPLSRTVRSPAGTLEPVTKLQVSCANVPGAIDASVPPNEHITAVPASKEME
jgi:hypothetical protein